MSGSDGFLGLFLAKRRAEPETLFARFNGAPITLAALGRSADAFATALRSKGIRRGDRVAVMLRNSPETLAAIFGLARAGVIWVPVNVQQRGLGLRYILEHCDPRMVVADADLVPVIRECGVDLSAAPLVVLGDATAPERLEAWLSGEAVFNEPVPGPDDCFAICYTSGTTGSPKGVMMSHAMLRYACEAVALVAKPRAGDVFLMWEPLYHIGGMQLVVLPLIREITLAMIDRFSAGLFWQQVLEYRATHIHFLGGILQILLKQPPGPLDREHGARIAWGGGCPKDVWQPFEARFGVAIRECYGMTEASSITTYNDSGAVGTVGRPVPWFSVDLQDEAGKTVATGERGEIVVTAHEPRALFPGYFRNPEATAKALRGGALHTGDLGRLDPEGNLVFLGRVTDSVRCRGENVSAWEVERVAAAHPAVEDCAMVGVAAEVGEQDILLYLQQKRGERIEPAAFSAWIAERLAAYQNPRYIAIVEEFERTPSQRIMKHKLPRDTRGSWDRLAQGPAPLRQTS
jgi:crotonobetaine/carnitine-CoA ligase